MTVQTQSSPEIKIALFRSLFRGREEVYPRRFESRKSGRAGYQPACGNEWVRGICEKPRLKCSDCPHQRWLPVTDDVVRWHLSGEDDRRQLPRHRTRRRTYIGPWAVIGRHLERRGIHVHVLYRGARMPRASSNTRTESRGSGFTRPARVETGVAISNASYKASSVASVTA